MSEPLKKGLWYALERFGFPTVVCVALGWMVYTNQQATREDYVQMRDTVTHNIGIVARELDLVIKEQAKRGEMLKALDRVDYKRDQQVAKIEKEIDDNQTAIYEMGRNRFKDSDGKRLEGLVAENTKAIMRMQEQLSSVLIAVNRVEKKM